MLYWNQASEEKKIPSLFFNKYRGFVPVKSLARYNLFFLISKKVNANIPSIFFKKSMPYFINSLNNTSVSVLVENFSLFK